MADPTIFDLSVAGRTGVTFTEPDVPETTLPQGFLREKLPVPEVSGAQVELVGTLIIH